MIRVKLQLHEKLRLFRRRTGLSIRQVAESTGISYHIVRGIERNEVRCHLNILQALGQTYGCSAKNLLDGTEYDSQYSLGTPLSPNEQIWLNRTRAGVSLTKFSKQTGIPVTRLSDIERGIRPISEDTFRRLKKEVITSDRQRSF